ncbi:MAG: hypothetical protein FWF81_13515 [Defluviitaleaceae bacterium]|nr:hypothetical protein [Defluviitaleaceae bacterium]
MLYFDTIGSYTFANKKGGLFMPKKDKDKSKSKENKFTPKTTISLSMKIFFGAVITVLVTVAGAWRFTWNQFSSQVYNLDTRFSSQVSDLNTRITTLDERLSGDIASLDIRLSRDISNLDTRLSGEIGELRESVNGLRGDIGIILGAMGLASIPPLQLTSAPVLQENLVLGAHMVLFSIDCLDEQGVIIGSDCDGNELVISDLASKRFYTSFQTDTGEEVWFLGGLDENLNWHGDILYNRKNSNGELTILELQYTNGSRTGVYSHLSRTFASDISRYVYRLQTNHTNNEHGYESITDYLDFDIPDESSQNLNEGFPVRINETKTENLIRYSRGQISNGLLNDNTGDAVIVRFFENTLEIRYLYSGRFENGRPHDTIVEGVNNSINSAFRISWRDDNEGYTFYKGAFNADGNPAIQYAYTYLPDGHARIIDTSGNENITVSIESNHFDIDFNELITSLDIPPHLLNWRT